MENKLKQEGQVDSQPADKQEVFITRPDKKWSEMTYEEKRVWTRQVAERFVEETGKP